MVMRELESLGIRAIAFDRKPSPYYRTLPRGPTFVEGDVSDFDSVNSVIGDHRISHIVHLAKVVGPHGQSNPYLSCQVNVGGSATVLEAARRHGIQRVIFSSSKSVYAPIAGKFGPPQMAPITEDYPKIDRDEPGFVPFYTVTNKMIEYLGIRYAMTFDLRFVILRFGDTYGPGSTARRDSNGEPLKLPGTLVAMMVEAAHDRHRLSLPYGADYSDDIVYNLDLARGIVASVVSDNIRWKDGWREFHLGSGRLTSLREFAEAVNAVSGDEWASVRPGPLHKIDHRIVRCRLSLERASRELGYEPTFGPVEGVKDFLDCLGKMAI